MARMRASASLSLAQPVPGAQVDFFELCASCGSQAENSFCFFLNGEVKFCKAGNRVFLHPRVSNLSAANMLFSPGKARSVALELNGYDLLIWRNEKPGRGAR